MRPEDELKLSFYKPVKELSGRHGEEIVIHVETGAFFVRKRLKVYDRDVYEILQREGFANIPKIAELIEDEGDLIVVEEYIQGKRLDRIMAERTFSEDEVVELILKICRTLTPLHRHDPWIVHRDIKPGNVMIKGEQPILLDFDISRNYDPEETRDTRLMGTRKYAAPEQYGFSQSSPRTDVYALGIMMNEMMTGTPDMAEESAGGRLGKIIKKCTAMDQKDRYADAGELANALMGKTESYAPPGFRSRKPIWMILAGVWYMIVLGLCFTIEPETGTGVPAGKAETIFTRFILFVILFGETFYLGNYRSVLTRFPFAKSRLIPVEILRIVLGVFLILFVPFLVLTMFFPAH